LPDAINRPVEVRVASRLHPPAPFARTVNGEPVGRGERRINQQEYNPNRCGTATGSFIARDGVPELVCDNHDDRQHPVL
jgi:hypothetical protein